MCTANAAVGQRRRGQGVAASGGKQGRGKGSRAARGSNSKEPREARDTREERKAEAGPRICTFPFFLFVFLSSNMVVKKS